MKIGIDARWLGAPGAGRYVSSVLRELQSLDQVNRYFVYCAPARTNVTLTNEHWQKRIFPETHIWGHVQLWLDAAWRHLDVFWATNQLLPWDCGRNVFKILTVHDLVWRLYPETMTRENYLAHRKHFGRSVRQADRIVTGSSSTGQYLGEMFGIRPEKVTVIPYGLDPCFSPYEKMRSARHIARKYEASEDYICTVGTIEPRKDQATLIRAMKILRDRGRLTHQLLIAGGRGWKSEPIYSSVVDCGLSEREVKFLGKIPDEDLPKLYSGAALFAYPSLYEGFGFPLLEAMACGTPVISSDAPAMPEVAGGAAILVPAREPEAFAEALSRVLEDPTLRQGLIEKGLRRAADFRWSEAAQVVLQIFENGRRPVPGSTAVQGN